MKPALAVPLARGRRMYVRSDALPYPILSFEGRTIDLTKPVEVYRNLRRGDGVWYSIRQGRRVVGHARGVMIQDAHFVVREAGRQRALKTGHKNVHAWVSGRLVGSGMGTCLERGDLGCKIRYNPRVFSRFYTEQGNGTVASEITSAMMVMIRSDGMTACYCEAGDRRGPVPPTVKP